MSAPSNLEVTRPLVSIIVPCRNYGHFLPDALASIVGQSWRPLEVVIVDDGSTDNTPDVIAAFKPPDITVRALPGSGTGPSAARNAALDVCRGTVVSFLDADDVLEPTAIAGLVECLLAFDADIVVGRSRNFYGLAEPLHSLVPAFRPFTGQSFANVIFDRPVPSAFLMKRTAIRFDPSLRVSEWLDFFLAYGVLGPRADFVDDVVTGMRQHDTPHRLTNANEHFEPLHRLEIVKRWRPRYAGLPQSSPEMRAALDHLTLMLAIAKFRRGHGLDPVIGEIDIANIRRWGIAPPSWVVFESLGVPLGLRLLPAYEKARDVFMKLSGRGSAGAVRS